MSNPFFSNNRSTGRRFSYGHPKHQSHVRAPLKPMNFTDNFSDFPVRIFSFSIKVKFEIIFSLQLLIPQPNLHNSTMNNTRNAPYLNRSFSNASNSSASSSMFRQSTLNSEKPSFSSLFTGNSSNNVQTPNIDPFPADSPPLSDDDGVFLQISNLDQWYDETNLRNYLMAQLKPITPILSLTIETPSIAKIKVPSIQVRREFAKNNYRRHFEVFQFLCIFFLFSSQSRWFHTCTAKRWVTSASSCRS
jgi:hypothetical protein